VYTGTGGEFVGTSIVPVLLESISAEFLETEGLRLIVSSLHARDSAD
jgi:hypothetical protein